MSFQDDPEVGGLCVQRSSNSQEQISDGVMSTAVDPREQCSAQSAESLVLYFSVSSLAEGEERLGRLG